MLRKKSEMVGKFIEHLYGGSGYVTTKELISSPDDINNKGYLMSVLTLKPGSEIAYHQHTGDMEVYFLMSGKGIFYDNDERIEMEPGDAGFTYDGEYHGFMNTGDVPAEMLCLILYNKGCEK